MKVSDFEDKVFTCVDCGKDFIWTASEQAFYTSKGLYPPKRDYVCRKARKASLVEQGCDNG